MIWMISMFCFSLCPPMLYVSNRRPCSWTISMPFAWSSTYSQSRTFCRRRRPEAFCRLMHCWWSVGSASRELIRSVVVVCSLWYLPGICKYPYRLLPAYPKMPCLQNTGCEDHKVSSRRNIPLVLQRTRKLHPWIHVKISCLPLNVPSSSSPRLPFAALSYDQSTKHVCLYKTSGLRMLRSTWLLPRNEPHGQCHFHRRSRVDRLRRRRYLLFINV